MFLDHTRRSTVGRTPLDKWSARRRDLYLTTNDIHNRQISMPPVGFEPKISAGEQPVAARLLRFSSWYSKFSLTPWSTVILDKLIVLGSLRNTPCLTELEHSLPFSSQPDIYPYPEADKFRLWHPILFKICFNIISVSMPKSAVWFLPSSFPTNLT